jgi:hypothetical protein
VSVLPSKDRKYLVERAIAFDEVAGPPKAVIFRGYPVPAGRFDHGKADFLIMLPDQYPDVRPDMFFAMPWLKLAKANRYPVKADQPFDFGGQRWQRWSRHNDQWRPGVDGIWTMLRRIEAALEVAA